MSYRVPIRGRCDADSSAEDASFHSRRALWAGLSPTDVQVFGANCAGGPGVIMSVLRFGRFRAAAVALSVVALLAAGTFGAKASTTTASDAVQVLANEVVPHLDAYADLGEVAADMPVRIVVALQHDRTAVDALERSLYDPASPAFHQWLTPDEFHARFNASPARVALVRSFVTKYGMQVYNPNGLADLTVVTGTAAQAEKTFHDALHRFGDTEGN